MGRTVELTASDGHRLRANLAEPHGEPCGGIVVYHLYPAGHGFNCTDRASFEPASAKLALQLSLEFLHRYVG
jgi:dienelactone hydrolase